MTKNETALLKIGKRIEELNEEYLNKRGYKASLDTSPLLRKTNYAIWICETEGSKKVFNTHFFLKLDEVSEFITGMIAGMQLEEKLRNK